MSQLRFDDQVVVVTGAGNGVGRGYALELARRGARVVVNDLGGGPNGGGADEAPAGKVVAEIKAAGGEAVANTSSVATKEGGASIIQTAIDTWGRVDGVIHNAGILRDQSLAKLDVADLQTVLSVHMLGAIYVCQPAFNHMKDNGRGGRLLLTSSSSGLFGNFGQSSYAAAKMAVVGLIRVWAIEGAKYGIKANVIAPTAATRLTGGEAADAPMAPGRVAPAGVVLMHPNCPSTGEIFQAGGGWTARIALQIADGYVSQAGPDEADKLFANWDKVRGGDAQGWSDPKTAIDLGGMIQKHLGIEKLF